MLAAHPLRGPLIFVSPSCCYVGMCRLHPASWGGVLFSTSGDPPRLICGKFCMFQNHCFLVCVHCWTAWPEQMHWPHCIRLIDRVMSASHTSVCMVEPAPACALWLQLSLELWAEPLHVRLLQDIA